MTQTEIVNIALGRLGESPVQSLDEGSVPARAAKLVYDVARQAALRDHIWSFALKEAGLARYSDGGSSAFAYSYALPFDCLRPLSVVSGGDYEVAGQILYSNSESVTLRYIADIKDTALFDSVFTEAFTYKLAADLAMSVKGSPELMANYNNAYTSIAHGGAALSAREGRKITSDNPYVDARFA